MGCRLPAVQFSARIQKAGKAVYEQFLKTQWPKDLARLRKGLGLPELGRLAQLRARLETVEPENVKRFRRRLGLRKKPELFGTR